MKIVPQSATLLAMTPDPMFLIERCGRVCYKSEEKLECKTIGCGTWHEAVREIHRCPACIERATKFVHSLVKRGHLSVLEHASATILLVTDRGLSHELVRHRIASFTQESTRYVNYGNEDGGITVVQPLIMEAHPGPTGSSYHTWKESCLAAEQGYLRLLEQGVQPQWARSVLPQSTKTEIALTANFREIRHILGLRLSGTAGTPHPQIVELMRMVLKELMASPAAPVFADFDVTVKTGGS